MKKTMLCGLLAAAALCLPVEAARHVPVQVDGILLEGTSYLEEGVTYAPLRSLLETMGGWEVYWDSTTRTAAAHSKNASLVADPAANTITVNGEIHPAEVAVVDGRTYVPLRLTAEALGGAAGWDPWLGGAAVTSPRAEHDASDLYWLSRIIYAESGAEPLEGQIAVGNVVLNRVSSPRFPNTVYEVIFQRGQFTPVSNGSINLTPNEQSVIAAKLCLDGANTVGNALYFINPRYSPNSWASRNRPYVATIASHAFYA